MTPPNQFKGQAALARRIATFAHAGQEYARGPYYERHLTPIAAAVRVRGDETEAMAWLHDVLEDTEETFASLLAHGVSLRVAYGVKLLTRVSGESYLEDYVPRLIQWSLFLHDTAPLHVKLADQELNMASAPGTEWEPLIETRWRPAHAMITEALKSD